MYAKTICAFFILASVNVHGQLQKVETSKFISVGRYRSGMRTISEMYYSVEDKDTVYHWQYDDARYSEITSYEWIDFAETGNTFNDLYDLLMGCFDKENGYQTSFKLGESLVVVEVKKSMGVKYLFVSPPTGYFMLGKGALEKLFGKK